MDYLQIRELFHSSDIQKEKARLVSEFEIFNRDFYEDLPYRVRDTLDSLNWRFRHEEWFAEAWEKYRQHVLNAGLGGEIKMPGFVFKPYLERYVDEHPGEFNLSLSGESCECAYSDMEVGEYLEHHGIKDQKWYHRRYQNPDGSLTELGRVHYGIGTQSKRKLEFRESNDAPKNEDKPKAAPKSNKPKDASKDNKPKDTPKKDDKPKAAPKDNKPKDISKDNKPKDTPKDDKPNIPPFLERDNKKPIDDFPKDKPKNTPKDDKPKDTVEDPEEKRKQKLIKTLSSDNTISKLEDQQRKNNIEKATRGMKDTKDILDASANVLNSTSRLLPTGNGHYERPDYSRMTDQELRNEINRMNLEESYARLKGESKYVKSGSEKTREVLQTVGAGVAVASSITGLIIAIKTARANKMSHSDEVGEFLAHHGVKGQKWGVRRYQLPNGDLTPEGKKRYKQDYTSKEVSKISQDYDKLVKKQEKAYIKKSGTTGARKGAITGAAVGAVAGIGTRALNDIFRSRRGLASDYSTNRVTDVFEDSGHKFVRKYVTSAFVGATMGALIGRHLGKKNGKASAKANIAKRGKEYTDYLLKEPIDRIKK